MSRERLWSGTGQVAVQSCAGSTTMSWNTARKALGFEACLQLQLHSAKSRPHPYRNGSSYLKLLPPALGGSTCLTLYLFRAETSIWSREDWATDASQLPRLPHLENVSESRKSRNRQHRITCHDVWNSSSFEFAIAHCVPFGGFLEVSHRALKNWTRNIRTFNMFFPNR